MPFVDFAEIRERVSIEDVADMLPVQWVREKEQLRATCPQHGSERSLIVTPAKGLFTCKTAPPEPSGKQPGGDCIGLCKHVMNVSMYEAGQYLAKQIGMLGNSHRKSDGNSPTVTVSKEHATAPQKQEGGTASAQPAPSFDPVAFAAKLVFSEEIAALGFSEEDAEHFGVGFYRGRVYAPLRYPNGSIAAFFDYGSGALKLPARNRWLEQAERKIVPFPKSA